MSGPDKRAVAWTPDTGLATPAAPPPPSPRQTWSRRRIAVVVGVGLAVVGIAVVVPLVVFGGGGATPTPQALAATTASGTGASGGPTATASPEAVVIRSASTPAPVPTVTATTTVVVSVTATATSAAVSDGVDGTWSGAVSGDQSGFDVVVSLSGTTSVTGDVNYPQLGCTGRWQEQSRDSEHIYLLETIDSGPCVTTQIQLTPADDGSTIAWQSSWGSGKVIYATLRR